MNIVNPVVRMPQSVQQATEASQLLPPTKRVKACKAAQEFEAVLLTSLFQKMQESVSTLGGGSEDCTKDSFRDFGVQELASAISASGGIGIAQMILPHLSREGNPEASSTRLNAEIEVPDSMRVFGK